MSLQVTLTNVAENSPSSSITALLTRNSDTTVPLTVSLSSSDTSERTAPASVQIPAGQSSATFVLTLQRDGIFDADALVTVTAAAASHAPASAQVAVLNRDAPRLHLSTEAGLVVEGATLSATVSHEAGSDLPVTVFLSTPSPRQLTLPAAVLIPAGQTSAVFAVAAVDDTFVRRNFACRARQRTRCPCASSSLSRRPPM